MSNSSSYAADPKLPLTWRRVLVVLLSTSGFASGSVMCGGRIVESNDASVMGPDAATDSGAEDDGTYHGLDDPRFWSSMDLAPLADSDQGFGVGCFDGRYAYWLHFGGKLGSLIRYDTRRPFHDLSSYSRWDNLPFGPRAFDGRYIYAGASGSSDLWRAVRYDTQEIFGASGLSLSTPFGGGLVDGGGSAWGFVPTTFDGHYVYGGPVTGSALTIRYDTQGVFANRAAWNAYDPGFVGVSGPTITAGPYLVFTPRPPESAALRYDTRLPFDSPSAWTRYPLKSIAGDDFRFTGPGSDGRYVYYVPDSRVADGPSAPGLFLRHDIQASLDDVNAWESMEVARVTPVANGFGRASWDGRFFYVMIGYGPGGTEIVARYDTRQSFSVSSSWSTFDFSMIAPGFEGTGGVVFDGEYVYIASTTTPRIVRFDARTPPKMPAGFSGCFF
jgi:hypothetical protein